MKELIKNTVGFFVENINSILTISFPYLILRALINNYQYGHGGFSGYFFSALDLIVSSIFIPIFIIFLSKIYLKKEWKPKEITRQGILYSPYILIVNLIIFLPFALLSTILNYLNSFFSLFSALLITIIFVVVSIKISFSNFLIVLENNKPLEAIRNSFVYTSDYIGKIIISALIFGIPILIFGITINMVNSQLFNSNIFIELMEKILSNAASLLIPIAFFKIYCANYFLRQEALK